DLLELALLDRIRAVFRKFPSLRSTAVDFGNLLCAAHKCSSRQNGALGQFVGWGNACVHPSQIKHCQSGKYSLLMTDKNVLLRRGSWRWAGLAGGDGDKRSPEGRLGRRAIFRSGVAASWQSDAAARRWRHERRIRG